MADHTFEQDRSYTDMESGQTKMFTIRDYSKKIKVSMNGDSTPEQKTATQKAYDDSTWEIVDELIDQNPAVFARESYKAVDVNDGKIEWNREGLFLMHRDPNQGLLGSDWNNMKTELLTSILEYNGHTTIPVNWESIVHDFKRNYQINKTI